MIEMGKHKMNPTRDKLIIDMKDGDEGYINNQSLGFDIVDNITKEAIYVLLHMSPVSTTLNESDDPDFDFTIKISCKVEDEQQFFTIYDNPDYTYINLDALPRRAYTILYQGTRDIIKTFDASREEFNDNKFYDEIYNFIETILEQDEDDESQDQIYGNAWSNFAENMTDIAPVYDRQQIENCLSSLAILSQQDKGHQEILVQLSDYSTAKKWIERMCTTDAVSGYIEPSLQKNIDSIAGIFYEIYVKQEVEGNAQAVPVESPKQTLEELQKALDQAINNEDFDQALALKEQIKHYKNK